MTLIHRRLLYISFFLIFFITAPVVILWAEGYKFNFKTRAFEKTGVLFLESNPKDAEIYLNNKLQKQKTTARIKNLMPGKCFVEVKKDGYKSWSKKLNIYPGSTTFAQYIRLFKNDLPTINILNGQNDLIAYSEKENGKIALAIKQDNLSDVHLLDVDKKNLTRQIILKEPVTAIKLNEKADLILIKSSLDWYLFNVLNQKILNLKQFFKLEIKEVVFDSNNIDIVYGLSKLGLEKIDLNLQKSERLIDGVMVSFYLKNNQLYYLEKTNNSCRIVSADINHLQEKIIYNLPCSENFKFFKSPEGIINLIDLSNKLLYIFDFNKKRFEDELTIVPNVKNLSWHENQKSLLFSNDYEIWTYQEKDKKLTKNLITRLSSKILDAVWFKFDTHVLYITDNGLFITEAIDDIGPYTVFYPKIKNSKKIFLNNQGNSLFWLTPSAIYQSEIQ